MKRALTIYGLSNDRTRIAYVGITKYSGTALRRRLQGHLAYARARAARRDADAFHTWLLENARILRITALEQTADPRRELAWMDKLRARGHKLFNKNGTVPHNPVYRVMCDECGRKFDTDDTDQGRNDHLFGRKGKYRICTSCDFTEGAVESTDEEGYAFVLAD